MFHKEFSNLPSSVAGEEWRHIRYIVFGGKAAFQLTYFVLGPLVSPQSRKKPLLIDTLHVCFLFSPHRHTVASDTSFTL